RYLEALPAHSLLECHIDALLSRYSVKGVKELGAALKGQVSEEVSKLLAAVKNPIEKAELVKEAAFKLMLEKELLEQTSSSSSKDMSMEETDASNKTGIIAIKPFNEIPR